MRHAPPVSVLCHGRLWRRAQAAVFAVTGAAASAWVASHLAWGAESAVPVAAAAGIAFAVVLGLCLRALAARPLELHWTGQAWQAQHESCTLELVMQARSFVLLRLRSPAGIRWVAVGRQEAGACWHGLLVALRARAPALDASTEGQAG